MNERNENWFIKTKITKGSQDGFFIIFNGSHSLFNVRTRHISEWR